MTLQKYTAKQTTPGEEPFTVTLPAEVSVKVDANKQVSFIIHAEESGSVKLPPLAAALLAADGETLFASADSRTLGSNQPHFTTVGKPKHTASNLDKEIDPQIVRYTLVAIGESAGGAGRKVSLTVRHA